MKLMSLLMLSTVAATPILAEETRQLDAHEHGVGQLNIAFEGSTIAMELHAPGADIVGFEYQAESDEDLASIDAALAVLAKPLDLFVLPDAAGCSVVDADAELESEEAHDDHDDHDDHKEDHDDHDHKEEGHDDHDEDEHDDRDEEGHDDHDDHKDEHDEHDHEEEGHDDHDKDEHDDHDDHEDEHDHDKEDHDDHDEEGHDDHDDHADEAGHTEFHAEYTLTCSDISAVTGIDFAYFAAFPNALEVEVQAISETGATAFEVERDAPTLDLSSLF
ncbi:DUF2796 domain-containing protein [Thalassobium sp. R2A62]|uniref:zinc uptake protein ZrgA n=1 Tax=Thalassobium sp. R2A62 TaxID=633131 RepID=UPI0001B1D0CC|nr:DUF2796 domain-containing protein [Thalassobium sp. R2A62]EET48034.1 hypothetical protein TR2A62_1501 [Thalassobium sp. R2A62]